MLCVAYAVSGLASSAPSGTKLSFGRSTVRKSDAGSWRNRLGLELGRHGRFAQIAFMTILPDVEAEFAGIYLSHWEVGRFVIEVGRKFWGLFPNHEAWMARFPKDFQFPSETTHPQLRTRGPGRFFKIRFIGVPSERGQFGHMGMCCRRVEIRQILEVSEVKDFKASPMR